MHIPEVVGKAAMITGRTCRLLPPPEYAAKALIKAWSTFRCRQMTSITDEMALTAWWGSDALQTSLHTGSSTAAAASGSDGRRAKHQGKHREDISDNLALIALAY
jgi:hypothetical protein